MASPTPYLSDLTRRFRAARAYHGIELKDAARELGCSTDTLRRIEQGVKPIPPTYMSWAINEWATPDWLLPRDDDARAGLALGGRTLQGAGRRSADRQRGKTAGDSDALGGTG
jgi:transcriptional regulator with XRE-family HTH domain